MLDQETPRPEAVVSLHLLAELESQASTLDLTECSRLSGLQEVQPPPTGPPLSLSSIVHTHTYSCTYTCVHTQHTCSCRSHDLESTQQAPPSVFLTSSRFLPPGGLSRQSCGGGFRGFGSNGLRMNCSGQNPHAKLSCQGGSKAWKVREGGMGEGFACTGPSTQHPWVKESWQMRVVGLQRPRPSVF